MKNVFALTLIAVATFVMASNCQAYQGRPDRQGPPGDRQFGGGPPQGRGGPGGQRGERGERGGPGGQRGGQRGGHGHPISFLLSHGPRRCACPCADTALVAC